MMKRTFYLILLLSILGGSSVWGQTQLIAHKSHSGTDAFFVVNTKSADNFGLPAPRLDVKTLTRLSDTLLVKEVNYYYSDEDRSENKRDTVSFTNKTSCLEYVKIMRERHPKVKLVGFDEKDITPKTEKGQLKKSGVFFSPSDPSNRNGGSLMLFILVSALTLLMTYFIAKARKKKVLIVHS